jgi:hypothetical protein
MSLYVAEKTFQWSNGSTAGIGVDDRATAFDVLVSSSTMKATV